MRFGFALATGLFSSLLLVEPLEASKPEPVILGRIVAQGEPVIVHEGDTVNASSTLLCFHNRRVIQLEPRKPVFGNRIGCQPVARVRTCPTGTLGCIRPKGDVQHEIQIQQPIGFITEDLRPSFAWTEIDRVNILYQIQMIGPGVFWTIKTDRNQAHYPEDKPSLEPGQAYRIVVTALENNRPIKNGQGQKTINTISPELRAEIRAAIQQIQMLQLSWLEEVKDIEQIYFHAGLIDTSVQFLSETFATTQNSEVKQLLQLRQQQNKQMQVFLITNPPKNTD